MCAKEMDAVMQSGEKGRHTVPTNSDWARTFCAAITAAPCASHSFAPPPPSETCCDIRPQRVTRAFLLSKGSTAAQTSPPTFSKSCIMEMRLRRQHAHTRGGVSFF